MEFYPYTRFERPLETSVDRGEGIGERLRSACDETFAVPQPRRYETQILPESSVRRSLLEIGSRNGKGGRA
jgi:hypothetical protein